MKRSTEHRRGIGHQRLSADHWTIAIYVLVGTAAGTRVIAAFIADPYVELLWGSALAWAAAFGLFTARFGRVLLSR